MEKRFEKEQAKRKFDGKKYKIVRKPSDYLILRSKVYGNLSKVEIEACVKQIRKEVKKLGRLECRVYPDIELTGKPLATRMGKGKGGRERGYKCVIKPGQDLFLIEGLSMQKGYEVLKKVQTKLSVSTYVSRF